MVIRAQIVIDGLGDMEAADRVFSFNGFLVDDMDCLGGIVAADIEEEAHVVVPKHFEYTLTVSGSGFHANRAEGGGWGHGHGFERTGRLLAQVDQVLLEDALYTVHGSEDTADGRLLLGFDYGTDEALVNNHRGAATLGDQHVLLLRCAHSTPWLVLAFPEKEGTFFMCPP